jgi:hypothetical protein
MTDRKFVTEEQFYAWMGSDTLKVHDLTALLLEIINGHYPVQVLREDVLSYETEGEAE